MEDNKALTYYERFDSLLKGNMEPGEQQLLEAELNENPDLQNEFDLFKMSVEVTTRSSIREEVKMANHRYLNQDQPHHKIKTVSLTTWAMRIAAGLLALMVCYSVVRFSMVNSSDIYSQLYTEYNLPITRSSDVEYAHLDSLYISGRYTDVMAYFQQLDNKTSRDYFLTGVSFLKEAEYDQAVQTFNELKKENKRNGTQDFEQESDYYLALAYLNNRNIDEALVLFKTIKNNPSHIYRCNVSNQDMLDLKMLKLKN